jgi:hypothetical protein
VQVVRNIPGRVGIAAEAARNVIHGHTFGKC